MASPPEVPAEDEWQAIPVLTDVVVAGDTLIAHDLRLRPPQSTETEPGSAVEPNVERLLGAIIRESVTRQLPGILTRAVHTAVGVRDEA